MGKRMKKLFGIVLILWTTNAAAYDPSVAVFLGEGQKPTAVECANAVENGNLVASTLIDGHRPMSVMAYNGFLSKIKIDDGAVFCIRKQKLR